jgi:hypothetical protein
MTGENKKPCGRRWTFPRFWWSLPSNIKNGAAAALGAQYPRHAANLLAPAAEAPTEAAATRTSTEAAAASSAGPTTEPAAARAAPEAPAEAPAVATASPATEPATRTAAPGGPLVGPAVLGGLGRGKEGVRGLEGRTTRAFYYTRPPRRTTGRRSAPWAAACRG